MKNCNHNTMISTGDHHHAWKCAECGYTYGKMESIEGELMAALTGLLCDLEDAREDKNPETGKVYESVAFARITLSNAKKGQPRKSPSAKLWDELVEALEDTLEYCDTPNVTTLVLPSTSAQYHSLLAKAKTLIVVQKETND